ncbi:hypothetical protein PR048_017440 [Dryococelus australis]|uniref:Very-long-chain (3R)-3-hydroxyacyl-CoA dehydratase n=1 Tax=Dryococelus australis TaxID=614101 RepID=A0ABQ9H9I3_9NEOP|nr:hypothetical protein PR048_017440 [Dryococelus australis]
MLACCDRGRHSDSCGVMSWDWPAAAVIHRADPHSRCPRAHKKCFPSCSSSGYRPQLAFTTARLVSKPFKKVRSLATISPRPRKTLLTGEILLFEFDLNLKRKKAVCGFSWCTILIFSSLVIDLQFLGHVRLVGRGRRLLFVLLRTYWTPLLYFVAKSNTVNLEDGMRVCVIYVRHLTMTQWGVCAPLVYVRAISNLYGEIPENFFTERRCVYVLTWTIADSIFFSCGNAATSKHWSRLASPYSRRARGTCASCAAENPLSGCQNQLFRVPGTPEMPLPAFLERCHSRDRNTLPLCVFLPEGLTAAATLRADTFYSPVLYCVVIYKHSSRLGSLPNQCQSEERRKRRSSREQRAITTAALSFSLCARELRYRAGNCDVGRRPPSRNVVPGRPAPRTRPSLATQRSVLAPTSLPASFSPTLGPQVASHSSPFSRAVLCDILLHKCFCILSDHITVAIIPEILFRDPCIAISHMSTPRWALACSVDMKLLLISGRMANRPQWLFLWFRHLLRYRTWGRGGVVVGLFASQQGEPGSIPGGFTPGISHVGNMPGDAAGHPAGFLGSLPLPPPLHSGAAPYSPRFNLIGSRDVDVKSQYTVGIETDLKVVADRCAELQHKTFN